MRLAASWPTALITVAAACGLARAEPESTTTTTATTACASYCDQMAYECPDVFLGNRATCLAACALYPPGTAVVDDLGCRIHGQADPTPIPQPAAQPSGPEALSPDLDTHFDDHPQLRDDRSVVPEGYGAVFLPSLELGPDEPIVTVEQDGHAVADGRPGRRIILRPGAYLLRFGNGAEHQQVRIDARVVEDRTTIAPVSWGSLRIDVVDPQFIPFRGAYELIRTATREVVGLGFGADELLGEQPNVWVLNPGVYKVVQSGGTYRDRTNFSTVRVLAGERVRFVLVQNPDTGDFEGAGIVPEDPGEADRAWRFTGLLGGDVVFLRSDSAAGAQDRSIQINVFFDVAARLSRGQHLWTTRLEVEESQSRTSALSRFQNLKDRLFLHTIYTYKVTRWFGPYARAGLESHILPRFYDFARPTEVEFEGHDITYPEGHRVRLDDPFAPVELIEGTGGNFQVFRSHAAELSLRVGFGALQVVPNGGLVFNEKDNQIRRLELDRREGIEATAIGSARLSRWVTLSTELDSLVPFAQDQTLILKWRNQINLRLASFASLTYRFNAVRNETTNLTDEFQLEHNVQLRFSYTLF